MDIFGDVPIIWWIASAGIVLTVLLSINSLRLLGKIEQERSLRRSQSTRYGQISEQFLPLVEQYPYDPKHFRFLGSPIDGVQFEEDKGCWLSLRLPAVDFLRGNVKSETW